MITTLPCIVCGRKLENWGHGAENQPLDGLVLWSLGSYGSTVFDPLNSRYLEINICDNCLVKAAHAQRVAIGDGSIVGAPLELWPGV